MPIVSLDTLKEYYEDGHPPTEPNYIDLIDTLAPSPGSVISEYLGLHGLRGFWPMTSVRESGQISQIIDLGGQGLHLTRVNTQINANEGVSTYGIPYAHYYTNRYCYINDSNAVDLLVDTSVFGRAIERGFTIGCWARVNVSPDSVDKGVISKYNSTGDLRSYLLYRRGSTNRWAFLVSSDGTSGGTVGVYPAIDVQLNVWYFLICRFISSTEIAMFINGSWYKNTTSIPANPYMGTTRFELGSFGNGAGSTMWEHQGTLYFICAAALSDSVIERLYNSTKIFFS